jgi:phage/plasmid-like protein (TIGR03299 family)
MPPRIAYSPELGRYQAMYVDKPAWHNLGTIAAGAQTPEAAMELAGTGYVVAKTPIYFRPPEPPVPNEHGNGYTAGGYGFTEIDSHVATYRTDTNQILGVVSKDYPVIQNITPMQMLGEIVRTKEAGIVAHAALGRGERLFAVLELARLKDLKIPGDPSTHDAFLVAQWWHDGTGSLTFGESMVRTECWNMADAQLLYAERKGRLARIVHRGNTDDAVAEAQRILGYAERDVLAFMEVLTILADQPIRRPTSWIEKFTKKLIPIPPEMDRPGSRQEARDAISYLFLESDTLVGVRKSPYRAFQAVTEYTDHYRPLRVADQFAVPARRFTSVVGGPAADMKRDAMRLLREEFEVH